MPFVAPSENLFGCATDAGSLTTARLIGRPAGPDDFGDMRLIHGDPVCKVSMEVPGCPMNEDYTRSFLAASAVHWSEHGFGVRVFTRAADGAFAGFGGLRRATIAGAESISLGFAIRASLWRQGLASEMVSAILTEGFDELGFARLVAITFPENTGSRSVLEKTGFRLDSEIVQNGLPHLCFRATADEMRLSP